MDDGGGDAASKGRKGGGSELKKDVCVIHARQGSLPFKPDGHRRFPEKNDGEGA